MAYESCIKNLFMMWLSSPSFSTTSFSLLVARFFYEGFTLNFLTYTSLTTYCSSSISSSLVWSPTSLAERSTSPPMGTDVSLMLAHYAFWVSSPWRAAVIGSASSRLDLSFALMVRSVLFLSSPYKMYYQSIFWAGSLVQDVSSDILIISWFLNNV